MSQTRWAPDLDVPTESGLHSVLLVAARYFPYMGGMETHVYEVGQRLARAGIRVTVLTTDLSGQLPTFEDMRPTKTTTLRQTCIASSLVGDGTSFTVRGIIIW